MMAISPMMRQYLSIKDEYKDSLLLFRLGDFYELFFDDAELVSKELELTLTGKECGLSKRAPMCGVPYHAAETYIARLLANGHSVAICEQMQDPAETKGLVERAVVRVITPGTVIEGQMLEQSEPNYIMSIYLKSDNAGIAFCDVSTGEFKVYKLTGAKQRLAGELDRISPREVILNDREKFLSVSVSANFTITDVPVEYYDYKPAVEALEGHFIDLGANGLDLPGDRLTAQAAGALMRYLTNTQKNALGHIIKMERYEAGKYLNLDSVAARNLELTGVGHANGKRGSLLWLMDKTSTAMGSRLLRSWIERPLRDEGEINARLDAVEYYKNELMKTRELSEMLENAHDIERLLSKIAYDSINPRDVAAIAKTLCVAADIKRAVAGTGVKLIDEAESLIDPMPELCDLLARAIVKEAPVAVKEGGIFQDGYNEKLDELRLAARDGKIWITKLESDERERTGIKNLKIGFNRVFGYYIEVTKSNYNLVPHEYTRKQTLANCERFITQELKELERKVLGADEEAMRLEYELYCEIKDRLRQSIVSIQSTSRGLKTLDCILSLAQLACECEYVRPQINAEGVIDIKGGRHPMVEHSLGREAFVDNDCEMSDGRNIMVITGPNMAGKSTYMRQVALITLMAHMGSFVPAKSANIPLTDRIFTRIGASDDLFGGQSTFMVEMNELATILKFATKDSLVILDEIGRGTSTFDGLAIAWAAVEYIAQNVNCRALFATHYHELSELEGRLPGVVNYRITAKEQGNDVIFLRKIVPGGADRSFGVAVASLAGLPKALVNRARQIMARLEANSQAGASIGKSILDNRKNAGNKQVSLLEAKPMEIVVELQNLDVMSITPIDALNLLIRLKEKARLI
ncbi:MAG: DNA mismatch repair protein MutS [Clostridia bacterium]|nr:DNA mismatch repair protein MutS [Clostridia bacterium]